MPTTTITSANSVFQATVALTKSATETINVDFGGALISTGNDGLDLLGTGQTYDVTVNGIIASLSANPIMDGIFLGASTANITIGQSGSVSGVSAIATSAGTANITNNGHVTGNSAAIGAIQENGNNAFFITNNGLISNINAGGNTISISGSGTHTFANSGVINAVGSNYAIISSSTGAIDNLLNTGTINGYLELGGGVDTVHTENGTINGAVSLGAGADFFYGSLAAANSVDGGAGNDAIVGGAGNDALNGGADNDTLTGGLGNDTYYVDSTLDVIVEKVSQGTADKVITSVSYTLGLAANYNIEFLETNNAAATTAINLTGNTLAQTITGNAGDNTIDGGVASYADTMIGGLGNDTYKIHNSGDKVIEAIAGGTDHVVTTVSYVLSATAYVETLETDNVAGVTAINLTGNALLGQTLTGNAGNNFLDGGKDNFSDTLIGGLGNDTYVLGSSTGATIDTVTDSGGLSDTITSEITRTLASYTSIENLTLIGSVAANGTGNGSDNVIKGNLAANVIDGGLGADTISGGAGNDTLTGGAGLDIFIFNAQLSAATNKDVITDFTAVDDTIKLENTGLGLFTTLALGNLAATAFAANATGATTTAAQKIIYNTATGALYYDADGNGVGAAIQFATLGSVTHPTITNADFFVI
jgi:Ca2+-binding RTX toxin-like protein